MPAEVIWRVDKPSDGLEDAMQRIALELADEGEYSTVEIPYHFGSLVTSLATYEARKTKYTCG